MIKAEQKDFQEIKKTINGHKKILIAGCGTCVTICFAGGEKEVGLLAEALRLITEKDGQQVEIIEATVQRQCEKEFILEIEDKIKQADLVLSMACSVGAQVLAEMYPETIVSPALNTTFMGPPVEQGIWVENCRGCGDCLIEFTGGLCPIARCAKNLLNGPCGGSQDGKCEISKDTPCVWQEIYDRLQLQNRIGNLEEIKKAKDWSKSGSGGPRKIVREDLIL